MTVTIDRELAESLHALCRAAAGYTSLQHQAEDVGPRLSAALSVQPAPVLEPCANDVEVERDLPPQSIVVRIVGSRETLTEDVWQAPARGSRLRARDGRLLVVQSVESLLESPVHLVLARVEPEGNF